MKRSSCCGGALWPPNRTAVPVRERQCRKTILVLTVSVGAQTFFCGLFRGILIRIFWNAIRRRRQSDWRIGFTPPTELRPRDQNYIPGKNRLPNQERNHISLARCTTGFITFLEPGSRSAQSSPLLDNVVAGTINAKTGHTKRISTT